MSYLVAVYMCVKDTTGGRIMCLRPQDVACIIFRGLSFLPGGGASACISEYQNIIG